VAALAWPDLQIAIPAAERQAWFSHFSEHGWQVLALTEVTGDLDKFEQLLRAKE